MHVYPFSKGWRSERRIGRESGAASRFVVVFNYHEYSTTHTRQIHPEQMVLKGPCIYIGHFFDRSALARAFRRYGAAPDWTVDVVFISGDLAIAERAVTAIEQPILNAK